MTKDGIDMAKNFDQLEPLKIWFAKPDEERGFYTLLTSGMPVHATRDGRYIISKSQCDLLTERGIKYERETPRETK